MSISRENNADFCGTAIVNRVEGKSLGELNRAWDADAALIQDHLVFDGPTGLAFHCPVEGCNVEWALNKDKDGILSRYVHVDLCILE